MKFNPTSLSAKTLLRIACRTFTWLLTLTLLTGTLVAQTDLDAKRIAAERLRMEGAQLHQEGTKESLEAAIPKFVEATSLYHSLGDRSKEAITLGFLGVVYAALGEKQKALNYLNQALQLRRDDPSAAARTLNNIGLVYQGTGEGLKALDYFAEALALARTVGDRNVEGTALNNIGAVHASLGEQQKALDYYQQALPIVLEVGNRSGAGVLLHNIGSFYRALGEKQKALDHLVQALALHREVGNHKGEADTLNTIGAVYGDVGENHKALAFHNQALALSRETGDRSGEAAAVNNIGLLYNNVGEARKAIEYYNQALLLSRALEDRFVEAVLLNNLGLATKELGEQQQALEYYNQALPLARAVGDRDGEAVTLFNIASLERDRGIFAEALPRIEAAIVIIESLRTKITSQALRSSYLATVQDYYELYIDLLMRLHKQKPTEGFDGKALQVSERGRARSLLETLAEANADIRQGIDATLLDRERTARQQLNANAKQQTQILSGPHTEAEANTVAQEIERLTTELQQVEAQIRQTSPRYAALTQPQPLTLKEIQTKVLDEDTILLEYSLGENQSYLWAVTPTTIISYQLPGRDEIEAAARQVYGLLSDDEKWSPKDSLAALRAGKKPGADRKRPKASERQSAKGEQALTLDSPETATRLSQMLLGPVAAQLARKRLVIVADGALQYIPFGALPSPTGAASKYQPLIIDHEIVTLPSASTLAVLRRETKDRKPAAKTVAVLADPVFESGDERVRPANKQANDRSAATRPKIRELPLGLERAATESGLQNASLEIPRLPGTREEARQILALVPATESKRALDFVASRQTATSTELSQYRYVHFATHGFLNSLHPELSGIVFSMIDLNGKSQDGFLRAHEVYNLKLPAELVVLSACQTGLGKAVKGEGLVGLTRGFMYAGAPRVVVSLWSVDDEATAELMGRFYRGMLKDKLRPAAALRAAQISLMKEKHWQSPFYWAAFTLQGEWR